MERTQAELRKHRPPTRRNHETQVPLHRREEKRGVHRGANHMGNKAHGALEKALGYSLEDRLVASRPKGRKARPNASVETLQGNCDVQDRKWPVSPTEEPVRCPRG